MNGWTALMYATSNGNKFVVESLLSQNAKVNLQDLNGWTALMYAISNGNKEIVNMLLNYFQKKNKINGSSY